MTAASRIRLTWIMLIMAMLSLATLAIAVPFALAQDSPGEVEVVGVIKAIEGGTTLTVNGLRIDTTGAEVQTAITVGAAVKVEGMLQPDGTIRARQVKAAEEDDLLPGEIEIVGALQALTPTSATVNGLVFDITAAEVQPGLAVGVVVKVHARLGDGGVWIAREIERFVAPPVTGSPAPTVTPPPGHRPIPAGADCTQCHDSQPQVTPAAGLVKVDDGGLEIIGTLEEVGTGYVVVGGQRFDTIGAEIKGQLIVGALVKLELTRLDSGILVAREVKPTTFDDSADDIDDDGVDDSSDGDSDDSGDDSAADGDSDDDRSGDRLACAFEIKVASANLRSGPGTGYDVIGYAFHDQKFSVVEIDSTGTWIKVALPDGQQGWLAISVGELDDDCSGLPVGDEVFKDDDHSGDDDSRDDSAFDDDHSDDSGDDDHGGERMDDSRDDDSGDDHGGKSGDDSGDDHGGDDDHGDDDHGGDDD
ncbi:MAG: hypothetical protein Kow00106_23380 [Anaerolineae bacterium]